MTEEKTNCPWCDADLRGHKDGQMKSIAIIVSKKVTKIQCPKCLRTWK